MTAAATEIDLRPMPPPRRHPLIFSTFDGLGPGEAFVLVNDHDPKPLLYSFQNERTGLFEWSVLETGPEKFRVRIQRRTAQGSRTVSDFLSADHRRLDALFDSVKAQVAAGDFQGAAAGFRDFRIGLERHIEIEEKVLFPVFEKATGMPAGMGPTAVMRMEHDAIKVALRGIDAALAGSDAAAFARHASAMVGTLAPHNGKEESILYPMTDQALQTPRDRDDLVRRMQAF